MNQIEDEDEDDDEDDAAAGLRHSRGPWRCQTNCFLRIGWHGTATAAVLIRNLRD
jgi:hypothetical protein